LSPVPYDGLKQKSFLALVVLITGAHLAHLALLLASTAGDPDVFSNGSPLIKRVESSELAVVK